MMGAWNDSLKSGKGLLSLRTLDWDMSGPFRDFPHITVRHFRKFSKPEMEFISRFTIQTMVTHSPILVGRDGLGH